MVEGLKHNEVDWLELGPLDAVIPIDTSAQRFVIQPYNMLHICVNIR